MIIKKALLIFAGLPAWAALNVPLTVQEALYAGGSKGIARTAEPFCMGVPLADSARIGSTRALGLSGATAGQFRVLASWADGNYKWIKICGIIPSMSGGGKATVTLTDSGSGNFGGANLATDKGTTIEVATGEATFSIKKANFNAIDSVTIGSTAVVASSSAASRGLVMTGPDPNAAYPGNVTCLPDAGGSACTTIYSSANDPNSTCTIEENGPVMAVVRCTGTHFDSASHPYMNFTAREFFFKGKSSVKITTVLRNADYAASAPGVPSADCNSNGSRCLGLTFNTAFKGFQSYELRLSPKISGTLTYTLATDSKPHTGTLSGSDTAYIYQGQSDWMLFSDGCDAACQKAFTPDLGYVVRKNNTTLAIGDRTKAVGGWADIADSSGAGVEIGMYQMSAMFPASLEFDGGGADVRIGMFASESGNPTGGPGEGTHPAYQAWPTWIIRDLYLNFHAAALASPGEEFLKYQHYLLARPARDYTNATGVFPLPLVDPAEEDAYYVKLAGSATPAIPLTDLCLGGERTNCTPDRKPKPHVYDPYLSVYRRTPWGQGGGSSYQAEHRWSEALRFLQRGYTGDFLNSAHHYRMSSERSWPHADGTSSTDATVNGFHWRDKINYFNPRNAELNGSGQPALNDNAHITNYTKSFINYPDNEHNHWYGQPDFYLMTGDETLREAMVPMKDYYLNPNTYQAGMGGGISWQRAFGILLSGAAFYSTYLASIGDPDAAAVLSGADWTYIHKIKNIPCVSGYPEGCTPPPLDHPGNVISAPVTETMGISRERGIALGWRSQAWCPAGIGTAQYRLAQNFMVSIEIEGLLNYRRAKGRSWDDYELAGDLAYGMAQWATSIESYNDDGTAAWCKQASASSCSLVGDQYNGFRYKIHPDFANVCPPGTPVDHTKGSRTYQIGNEVWDGNSTSTARADIWWSFLGLYETNGSTEWARKMNTAMIRLGHFRSHWPTNLGGVFTGALIHAIHHPYQDLLQDVSFTVADMGSGNYRLTFTPPAGVTSLRIKWSPKLIAPSSGLLGYDAMHATWGLDPKEYATWFGANTVKEPPPGPAGVVQNFAINTSTPGLKAGNFSVKAYVAR